MFSRAYRLCSKYQAGCKLRSKRRNLSTKRIMREEDGWEKKQEGQPRTTMLKFDPTVKNKHETLKRKAQDKEEWRCWSTETVFGQNT